ncbi:oxidoreductase [Abyssalbus ytuae]|uniref:Oxidoreductase n=1 Tax=Abyssalbus ytuae TaxID=2926907 RepID=A0A9E6ZTB8_9FLAO|nr:oxidoreductase [Abyssalbus ytuae]UOB17443.1 oxidoreductase [Abyssalbus ytuae]
MNRVILITGASSGMGKTTAELLLKKGYTVYGAARRTEKMNGLIQAGAKILSMDVTDENSVLFGIEEIIKNEGRIDILINNAGFGLYGAIEDVAMKDAKYQMDVNVFGLARLTQLVLPYMRKQASGKIVNISSIGGKLANPLGGWYHASKFALEALSDSLRMEVKQFGIDVIIIEPGGIKSEWSDIAMKHAKDVSQNGAYGEMVKKMIETGEKFKDKNAEPDVIANLIVKAITTKRPKARYTGGFMAKQLLFIRKILSDRQWDKMILDQFR